MRGRKRQRKKIAKERGGRWVDLGDGFRVFVRYLPDIRAVFLRDSERVVPYGGKWKCEKVRGERIPLSDGSSALVMVKDGYSVDQQISEALGKAPKIGGARGAK